MKGLFYGDVGQFFAQIVAAAILTIFGCITALVLFRLSERVAALRVSADIEMRDSTPAKSALSLIPISCSKAPRWMGDFRKSETSRACISRGHRKSLRV